jgi:hypothetical protein
MFIFWLIFLLISIGILLFYKKGAREDALKWKGDTEQLEITFRYLYLIVGTILSVVGLLGLLGIIKVR